MVLTSLRLLAAFLLICSSRGTILPEPHELRSSNGVLNVTLEVTVRRSTEGPFKWNHRCYNGQPVGPTLRVKPGDKLNILIINHLTKDPPNAIGRWYASQIAKNFTGSWMHDRDVYTHPNYTNLHLHGMHVSPEGCHDNILRTCEPESQMMYEYEIPKDHSTGTFWYHPHLHGSSALQVASGMVGALIVEDEPSTLDEIVLVLHEVSHSNMPFQVNNPICYFCIDNFAWPAGDRLDMQRVHDKANFPSFAKCGVGKVPNTTNDFMQVTQPFDCTYMLVNGAFQPEIPAKAGVYQHWRLVQSSHSSAIRFIIDGGCEALMIARDGRPLRSKKNVTGVPVVVTAGSRADFAIRCPAPGTFPITSLPGGIHESSFFKKTGTTELYEPVLYPGQLIATIKVAASELANDGQTLQAAAVTTPRTAFAHIFAGSAKREDLLSKTVNRKFKVVYNLTGPGVETARIPGILANGGQFSINGKTYTNRTEHCMVKGEVEEWTIFNAANDLDRWMHSFHIHQSWYQIVSQTIGLAGQLVVEDMEPGDWRDTVQIPVNGSVTIRVQMDFLGMLPFHCHVGAHQDVGMMQLIQVVQDEKECPAGTLSARVPEDVLI